jgi:hypothetical protein
MAGVALVVGLVVPRLPWLPWGPGALVVLPVVGYVLLAVVGLLSAGRASPVRGVLFVDLRVLGSGE